MATQTTELEFRTILKSNPKISEAIEAIINDCLVEEGFRFQGSVPSIIFWDASIDVNFIEETYEDEE